MRLSLIFTALLALLVVATPLGIALAQEASPVRALPEVITPGETFEVRVTFTAPADMFNAIGVIDTAPEGWNVTVNEEWCDPVPEGGAQVVGGNTAQYIWIGPFDAGRDFKAVYKVTVPPDASVGSPAFDGELEYYIGSENHIEKIGGAGAGGPGAGWIIGIVVGIAVIVAVVLLLRRRRKAAGGSGAVPEG